MFSITARVCSRMSRRVVPTRRRRLRRSVVRPACWCRRRTRSRRARLHVREPPAGGRLPRRPPGRRRVMPAPLVHTRRTRCRGRRPRRRTWLPGSERHRRGGRAGEQRPPRPTSGTSSVSGQPRRPPRGAPGVAEDRGGRAGLRPRARRPPAARPGCHVRAGDVRRPRADHEGGGRGVVGHHVVSVNRKSA